MKKYILKVDVTFKEYNTWYYEVKVKDENELAEVIEEFRKGNFDRGYFLESVFYDSELMSVDDVSIDGEVEED